MDLNSREQALLIWFGIAFVAMLLMKSVRPSLFQVLKALFQAKLVDILGLAALYTAGCVWLLERLSLWDWRNLKTVILWYLTTAFVAMMGTKELERGPVMFRKLVMEALTVSAIVVFIGGLNTLPLWAELLLLPFLTFIGGLTAMAERMPEHKIVLGPLNMIAMASGLFILWYSVHGLITDWLKFDTLFQAHEFVVPIALTILFLPYLYCLMIYMGFENAAIRLRFRIDDEKLRRYVWQRGALAFGLRPATFARYVQAIQMADITDRSQVANVVATMRAMLRRERNPPAVDWELGWSPYEARNFLIDHGLRTDPYHPTIVDWSADSPSLKLGGDPLPDKLYFRLSGTKDAATELEPELDARFANSPTHSDEYFWLMAAELLARALGDETAERFESVVPTDQPLTMAAGKLTILLTRDEWDIGERGGYSRKLRLRHWAYVDPFAALTQSDTSLEASDDD